MLAQTAAFGWNHLLEQQAWARERLRAHAGQTVEFRSPPLPPVRLRIDDSGRVAAASPGESDLVVAVKPGVWPFLMRRGPDTSRAFDLTGRADLADTVRELLQHLDWDAEEDLSRLIGDVAAHRVATTGRELAAWQREAAERLAQNVAEYFSEEKALVLGRPLFESFRRDSAALLEALDRLEDRLLKVESAASRDPATRQP